MPDLLIVPKYTGVVDRISPTTYMLEFSWPILPNIGRGLRLNAFKGVLDSNELVLQPLDSLTESIVEGHYNLKMFFYYRTPKQYTAFPITLVFVAYGPDLDVDGYEAAHRQSVVGNFMVV